MLSPSDAQVVARDPQLPSLPVLLDPPLLLDLLSSRLPHVELKRLTCTYLRYKPRTNCLALYLLETSLGKIELYAKAYAAGDAEKSNRRQGRQSSSILGPGELDLPDPSIGVSVFPNDAALDSLAVLNNDSQTRRLLKRLLPQFAANSACSIRRLSYKPERRYVGQLVMDGHPHAVLRFYTESDFLRASRNAKVLRSGSSPRLPERLGRSRQYAVTALQWLEGALLSELLAEEGFDAASLSRVGRVLSEWHATDAGKLEPKTRPMEVESLTQSAESAAAIYPELREDLHDLCNTLGQHLLEQPSHNRCVHGDLYAQQILLQTDGIAFLDPDEAYRGDPAADIGNFLAHLLRQAPHRAQAAREALINGYAAGGGAVDIEHISRYTAVSLLRLISEPFRRREPNWPAQMQAILQQAQSLLASSTRNPSTLSIATTDNVPVDDPFSAADDPRMPFLADATNPARVSEIFATHLPWPARLRALRVIRYKPQRRCLIEYDVETSGPESTIVALIGKARARRLDKETFHLHGQLWRSGFDDCSEDGICVPEPIALVPPWQMWLQKRVPGIHSIDRLIAHPQSKLPSRLADAIFKLHRCSVHPARSHTMRNELENLQEKLPLVGQHHPNLRARLQRLLEVCSQVGESLYAAPICPIHRDFYHDQVIVDGSRLYLLDLDLFAMGDPTLDVGNFIGHLIEYGLRKFGSADALAKQQEEMIGRYLELAGKEFEQGIGVYSSLTLTRHIYISTLFEDRTPLIEGILSVCEQRLAAIAQA
ncbi:MAG TPA: phosphotransferase [Tepidisphaeraceae bacterium]|jgi:aminoglycoside phosphotransferase (APT) family kinase protein|nr:phosphotransferase [Tepidisphaeraceae bacterium]